jgi:tripartite-type tricarboxylate transporter receptor subunit TctC
MEIAIIDIVINNSLRGGEKMLTKKSKSIVALILVALMCFAAVGCSKPAATAPAATAPNATTASASGSRPEGVPADFPNKEIEWIYSFGAGSPMDAYFRILADKIQKT